SKENFSVQCTSAGVPISGAFTDAVGQVTVYSGSTDVTASATFSSVATSCTGSVNTATNTPVTGARGSYRITALSADAGVLQITVSYGGQTAIKNFVATKVLAGAASVGNSYSMSGASFSSATYVDITGPVASIAVNPGGTIHVGASGSYIGITTSGTFKIQYRANGGTWTDFPGTEAFGSMADAPGGSPMPGGFSTGDVTMSGPGVVTIYDFRVLAHTDSGTTLTMYPDSFLGTSWEP
ncbi:MAG TPA: hypothetical protein VEQ17_07970, partial [Steroidobacteraceae bacterium]|nr:hypothetical protein [Steroidobacteraceae bacterium]